MKSILKSMKRKVTSEQMKAAWEQDAGKPGAKTEKISHIQNKHLPRCRSTRTVSKKVLLTTLPSLRDATPATRSRLLIRKVRLCSYVFAFSDEPDSPQEAKEKEIKRSALLELVNYLTVFKPSFTEEELEEIFEMLACNLFRPLPASTLEATGMYNPEEDEPQSEPTWPHLQVVYEFLLRLATSSETDSKLLDKCLNRQFVLNLLELFDSEDPRERDYLKTILHRIYGNFMGLRPFIRRAINNVFYRFIYETDRHNGIAELLEIMGSIINGFALPLKEQHKQFLARVLLPLHKVTYVSVFHPQLSYCVTQFLEKDPTLAPGIVHKILKYWPVTSSKKELMFLNELEEILDRIQSHHLGSAQIPLFKQIGNSINSPHFQVSERAIYVLNNDVILRFITNNREALVPILTKALYNNTFNPEEGKNQPWRETQKWQDKGHWNPTIVELTADILKLFVEMDQSLMSRTEKAHVEALRKRMQVLQVRTKEWASLDGKLQVKVDEILDKYAKEEEAECKRKDEEEKAMLAAKRSAPPPKEESEEKE